MPLFLQSVAGHKGFVVLCCVAGALLLSRLGPSLSEPDLALEKIVLDHSDLTRFDEIGQRVVAGHDAVHELKAAQEKEAQRRLATEAAERQAALQEARSRTAMPAQPDRRKKMQTARRETPSATDTSAPAAPLVITPAVVAEKQPADDGLESVFGKVISGFSKIRAFVVNAITIDHSRPPFGSATASSDSPRAVDDRNGVKLPGLAM